MADEDPLDRETSVSAQLTPTGVKAKAKSRLVAAVDRLGGNIVDLANMLIEPSVDHRRSKMNATKKIGEALVDSVVKQIGEDADFARRAAGNFFQKAAREQLNVDAVMNLMIEDLRNDPPSDREATSGPDKLSEEFTTRFEDAARFATSDALRERWAKVLASEIRKPGTFGAKALRVIDELDPEVARAFEDFCKNAAGGFVPRVLSGDLSHRDRVWFTQSGLLVDPGILTTHLRLAATVRLTLGGAEFWVIPLGTCGVGVEKKPGGELPVLANSNVFEMKDGAPALKIHQLSDVGASIASIFPNHDFDVVRRLLPLGAAALPQDSVREFVIHEGRASLVL